MYNQFLFATDFIQIFIQITPPPPPSNWVTQDLIDTLLLAFDHSPEQIEFLIFLTTRLDKSFSYSHKSKLLLILKRKLQMAL